MFITLILKIPNTSSINQYQPISRINIIYKIISKVTALRLAQIIPNLISPHWMAFVKGKLIVDNYVLAKEMIKGYRQKATLRSGGVSRDFTKAFDSVGWQTICHTLCRWVLRNHSLTWYIDAYPWLHSQWSLNGNLLHNLRVGGVYVKATHYCRWPCHKEPIVGTTFSKGRALGYLQVGRSELGDTFSVHQWRSLFYKGDDKVIACIEEYFSWLLGANRHAN